MCLQKVCPSRLTKVKTQQVVRSRGKRCGDIELAAFRGLSTSSWIHKRWGSRSNPVLNGKLHYVPPPDIDKPVHDDDTAKIREYRTDYNNRPSHSISFMPAVSTSTT